jgi:hypothetical protein
MAFTRFHDDINRLTLEADMTSYANRYYMNPPGQGLDLPFLEDPQMRLQRWGANMRTNAVNLESELIGLSRPLNRDNIEKNEYTKNMVSTESINYRNENPMIDESRATHPAWMFRDIDNNRWEEPWINPQAGLEKEFPENIQTRILEKDNFDKNRT